MGPPNAMANQVAVMSRGAPSSLIQGACRNQDWRLAVHLLQEMLPTERDQKVVSKVIVECASAKQWQVAIQLLAEINIAELMPDVYSFSAAITACEKGLKWQLALQLLSQMISMRVDPSVFSFSASISACEKGSEWPVALHLLFANAHGQSHAKCVQLQFCHQRL